MQNSLLKNLKKLSLPLCLALCLIAPAHATTLSDLLSSRPTVLPAKAGDPGHTDDITALAYSHAPNGRILASASRDGTVKLWAMPEARLLHDLPVAEVEALAFNPNGDLLAMAGRDIKLWSIPNGAFVAEFGAHAFLGNYHAVAFSSDGSLLATGGSDNTVKLWDPMKTGNKLLNTLSGHEGQVLDVAFSLFNEEGDSVIAASEDLSNILASASADNWVKMWDTDNGTERQTIIPHIGKVYALAFSPVRHALVTTGEDREVKMWSTSTATQISGSFTTDHSLPVNDIVFSPDGGILATASDDGTVKLWRDGRVQRTWDDHDGKVSRLAFSRSGQRLYSGGEDNTIRMWDTCGYMPRNEPPTAAFTMTPSTGLSAPATVTVNGATSSELNGGIALYSWQVSDGQHADTERAQFTFDSAGEYRITLSVIDECEGESQVTQTLQVCSFNVNPTSDTVPATGGEGRINVGTAAGCTWTAVSNAPWLHVTAPSANSVTYTADSNPGTTSRTGTLSIGGQTVEITQPGKAVPKIHVAPDKLVFSNAKTTESLTRSTRNSISLSDRRVETISAGDKHVCAIQDSDNTLVCWGNNDYAQIQPPSGRFLEVSAGHYFNCGLTANYTLACWGRDTAGETSPPADTSPSGSKFIQIAAGGTHACALQEDGNVRCWGNNADGRTAGLPGPFKQLALGDAHSCGLRLDGSVECWGLNDSGQASVPSDLFSRISAGFKTTCGIRLDGEAVCWGYVTRSYGYLTDIDFALTGAVNDDNAYMACGIRADNTLSCPSFPVMTTTGRFDQVTTGGDFNTQNRSFACGVQESRLVACWGYAIDGSTTPPVDLVVSSGVRLLTPDIQVTPSSLYFSSASTTTRSTRKASKIARMAGNLPLFKKVGVVTYHPEPSVLRVNQVELEWNAFQQGGAYSEQIIFNLFEDAHYTLINTSMKLQPDGTLIWTGRTDDSNDEVVMLGRNGKISADFSAGTASYRIRPLSGGLHVIQEMNPAAFADPEGTAKYDHSATEALITPPRNLRRATRAAEDCDEKTVIDVMVVYTANAAKQVPNINSNPGPITQAIASANLAYDNSGICQELRLVPDSGGIQISNYQDGEGDCTNDFNVDLSWLRKQSSTSKSREVHELRDKYGADLVSLWVKKCDTYKDEYGLAPIMTKRYEGSVFASQAFSVVDVSSANVPRYTFAHELGHNMGGDHDYNHKVSLEKLIYSDGYGYTYTAGAWSTIMSYMPSDTPFKRILNFSNPDIRYEGHPTGNTNPEDIGTNNAKMFNHTRKIIADFRGGGETKTFLITNQGTANLEVSDIVVKSEDSKWLKISPTGSFFVSPQEQQQEEKVVEVTVDYLSAPPNITHTSLTIRSNDPLTPEFDVGIAVDNPPGSGGDLLCPKPDYIDLDYKTLCLRVAMPDGDVWRTYWTFDDALTFTLHLDKSPQGLPRPLGNLASFDQSTLKLTIPALEYIDAEGIPRLVQAVLQVFEDNGQIKATPDPLAVKGIELVIAE